MLRPGLEGLVLMFNLWNVFIVIAFTINICYTSLLFRNGEIVFRGDKCRFRHEESALGCEVVCPHWQRDRCLNPIWSFCHMERSKKRNSIPCFWKKHLKGCRKPHCPFLHSKTVAAEMPEEGAIRQDSETTVSPTEGPLLDF